MHEDALNLSIRRFLKEFGVSAQREIERAVREGIADGSLKGTETLKASASLRLQGTGLDHRVDGDIALK